MKTIILSILYFLIGALFIVLPGHTPSLFGFVLKGLMIPSLMVIFLINLRLSTNRLHKFMFAGLFFSWAGDVILEIPLQYGDFFTAGLASFLVAQMMYFFVFITTPGKSFIKGKKVLLLVPVIITGMGLIGYLYDDLGSMRIPVMIYAAVILTMVAGAINRFEKVERKSYYTVLAGAILFLISDSTIAISKFSHPFRTSGTIVISTYLVAQFLIITGYIGQFRNKPEQVLSS